MLISFDSERYSNIKGAEKVNADAIAAEIQRATKTEEALTGAINGLKEVARTGMINDLEQKEGEELIFDCGDSGFTTSV